jgi:hypothetical protein
LPLNNEASFYALETFGRFTSSGRHGLIDAMRILQTVMVLIGFVAVGCTSSVPNSAPPVATVPPKPTIKLPSSTLTVKQRSTTPVTGSANELSLTIDDITHGQVMASLIGKDGQPLLGPVSLKVDQSTPFRFYDTNYTLKLVELNNAVIGEDFASFSISEAGIESLTEAQKIERLIAIVENMSEAVFVRNGVEHRGDVAAEHLSQKLEAAGDQITTAIQFIELIASRSSTTGQEYEIRFANGRTMSAAEFLRGELAKIEAEQ